MKDPIQVHTCRYVVSSDIFEGCPLASSLFTESNPKCTWGDNNRSMVTHDVIGDSLADMIDVPERGGNKTQQQVRKVLKRLAALPHGVYIDLEN